MIYRQRRSAREICCSVELRRVENLKRSDENRKKKKNVKRGWMGASYIVRTGRVKG